MSTTTSAPPTTTTTSTSPTSSSSSGNLVSEFESAYSEMLSTLTQDDDLVQDPRRRSDAMQQQEEEKIARFMSLARRLETFFLQKRLLIHSHKPEAILREDSNELRQELLRKDELLRAHYDKLAQWQAMLTDRQQQQQQQQPVDPKQQGKPGVVGPPGSMQIRGPMPRPAAAPGAPMMPGIGAPQGGFVPGNNYRMMMSQPQQPHQN